MCKLQNIRDRKAASQGWICYYCEQPMWKDNQNEFASRHSITLRQARLLQATAEHLLPRSDGGPDCDANIAAACRYCNIKRHQAGTVLSPAAYAKKVRRQLRRAGWHGLLLNGKCVQEKSESWPEFDQLVEAGLTAR